MTIQLVNPENGPGEIIFRSTTADPKTTRYAKTTDYWQPYRLVREYDPVLELARRQAAAGEGHLYKDDDDFLGSLRSRIKD